MNAIVDEVDAHVLSRISGLSRLVSNQEIMDAVTDGWPHERHKLTNSRVGKAMRRAGFVPWRTNAQRGWDIKL